MSAVTSTTSTTENYYVRSTEEEDDTSSELTQEDFMLLLITQLQNQDPLEPMDNSEMISQVSEMEALEQQISQSEALESVAEQMSALTESLSDMSYDSRLQSASSLVGFYVIGQDSSGNDVEGMVLSAAMADGEVTLTLHSGDTLAYDSVTEVTMAVTSDDSESE